MFGVLDFIFPHVDSVINEKKYDECTEKLTNTIISLGKPENANKYSNFKIKQLKLFEILVKNNVIKFGKSSSRRTFYTKWYNSLLQYFREYFEIEFKTKTELVKDRIIEFNQPIVGKIKVNMNIFRIKIKKKSNDKYYNLFYIKYKTNQNEKYFNHILNISPRNSKITIYGLDDKYVSCGVLINKIFEYIEQIGVTLLESEENEMNYTFIGDIFNVDWLP